jgi:hypothetical protein
MDIDAPEDTEQAATIYMAAGPDGMLTDKWNSRPIDRVYFEITYTCPPVIIAFMRSLGGCSQIPAHYGKDTF